MEPVDPFVCPKCRSADCTEISDLDTNDMPDQAEQGYYCSDCETTYRVVYVPYKSELFGPV